MRNRAFRSIAAMLSILILTGIPAQAGPIAISQVIQVLNNSQNQAEIRLRDVSQYSSALAPGIRGSVQPSAIRQSLSDGSLDVANASNGATVTSDTLLSGLSLESDPQTIEVIDQGDVEGTVCDCGEIAVPGGGFPKWPLLFLAAIPFFFIHGCDHCETPPPPPPPPPTPTPTPPIPEPGSLLLFSTGLAAFGAGLRRRYTRARLAAQIQATEED